MTHCFYQHFVTQSTSHAASRLTGQGRTIAPQGYEGNNCEQRILHTARTQAWATFADFIIIFDWDTIGMR